MKVKRFFAQRKIAQLKNNTQDAHMISSSETSSPTNSIDSRNPNYVPLDDRSALYMQLDSMIDYLKVYRKQFKGQRLPQYEHNFNQY